MVATCINWCKSLHTPRFVNNNGKTEQWGEHGGVFHLLIYKYIKVILYKTHYYPTLLYITSQSHVTLIYQLWSESTPLQPGNQKEDDGIDTINKFAFEYCKLAGSASGSGSLLSRAANILSDLWSRDGHRTWWPQGLCHRTSSFQESCSHDLWYLW